jgi:hypothetical protein
MKSCRNCENSTHAWGYRPDLICRLYQEVVVRVSRNLEENKASDTYAQTTANNCRAYTPEELN